MRRTTRDLTDVEMIDALEKIISTIIDDYKGPVAPEFRRESRAAQIGYKTQRILLDYQIIEVGEENEQKRLEL